MNPEDGGFIGRSRRARGRARGSQPQAEGYEQPGRSQAVRHLPSRSQQLRPSQEQYRERSAHGERQGMSDVIERIRGAAIAESASGPGGNGTRGTLRNSSRPSKVLVTKPNTITSKQGDAGHRIQLMSNFFKMVTVPDWSLYHYHVDFNPDVEVIGARKSLLFMHKDKLGGYLFDGSSLWTTNRLYADTSKSLEFMSKRDRDVTAVKITIKLVGAVENTDYHYIQIYNVIIRKCLSALNLQCVGRNYYNPNAKIKLEEHQLELWPGYETSIRQKERDILMSVEISNKVMRLETALDIIKSYQRDRNYEKLVKADLIGCTVLTAYNNRTYRIDDIDFNSNASSMFLLNKAQKQVSYIDYYYQQYNIRIRNERQPLLISMCKARDIRAGRPEYICLLPELCRMMGLTDSIRSNYKIMKALAVHTRVGPGERMSKLAKFSRQMIETNEVATILKSWNLKFSPNLIDLPGRALQIEAIFLGRNLKKETYQNSDWTNDMKSNDMATVAPVKRWAIIIRSNGEQDAMGFARLLNTVGSRMGFSLPQPQVLTVHQDRKELYAELIEHCFHNSNPELMMIIVPNNRADRYSVIKKMCYVELGVPSQVVLEKNVFKGNMSIATKIAIQLNAKLGGVPWFVRIPLSGLMVVGFDVCHDTLQKQRSFGATVASLDKNITRYFSCVSAHASGVELSDNFGANITKAVHKYQVVNNSLPLHIVIYRDGVGEGQLEYVFEHEVQNIKNALKTIYDAAGVPLKFAFVIVTKQIATRFFVKGTGSNPPPGTVIDDVVTDPTRYDFYLISQSVNQGTVSPTYYNVIDDSCGLPADKMQRLTYKLTHLYYNWSGTIRVPAPCQFAHKLAFLTSQSLHTGHNNMDDLLYFL